MSPVSDLPVAIGIDIGGTHTKLAVVNAQGHVLEFARIATQAGQDLSPYLLELEQALRRLYTGNGRAAIGLGVSFHGFLSPSGNGPIVCPLTPALNGFNLRGWLAERFDLPVILNADLTAHALAEYHFGVGQGKRRFLALAIGTGLGAGLVIDGQALKYLAGGAGDTGHIILQPGGPTCSMGCHGCAEALCGVGGIERLAREQLGVDYRAHEVIAGARAGDPARVALIRQIGDWLGQLCASLFVIYWPEQIALTGGVSEAGNVLLEACERTFFEYVGGYHRAAQALAPELYSGVSIRLGQLRGQAGILGAVSEFLVPTAARQSLQ